MRNEIKDKINKLDALQDILGYVDERTDTYSGYMQEEEVDSEMHKYYEARLEIWVEIQKFLEKKI